VVGGRGCSLLITSRSPWSRGKAQQDAHGLRRRRLWQTNTGLATSPSRNMVQISSTAPHLGLRVLSMDPFGHAWPEEDCVSESDICGPNEMLTFPCAHGVSNSSCVWPGGRQLGSHPCPLSESHHCIAVPSQPEATKALG
jgi:hypothetical protein